MMAGAVRRKREHLCDDGHLRLLKFAAVYGANVSGKSNLVKALDLMRTMVVSGLPEGHTQKYCRVDPGNKNRTSYGAVPVFGILFPVGEE